MNRMGGAWPPMEWIDRAFLGATVSAPLDTRRSPASTGRLTMDAPPPDEVHALLKRVLAGDRRAAHDFTEHNLLPLLEVAVTRMLSRRHDARFEREDVIQGVFEHFHEKDWERLRKFDPARGALANFVWKVAENWSAITRRARPAPAF